VIEFLAQTSQPAGGGGLFDLHGMMIPMLILLGVMYFAMVMPKRKQDKQRKDMLTNMKRGDEVTTIGGIIGKVVDPKEDRVLVKVDESSNTKIWFSRSAIAKITAEDSKTPTTTK
jgi:preprotein translocase subunit YajC